MRILVCIKQVPGTTKVEVDENGVLIRDGVASKMNPYDLFAIETAMRLKEKHDARVYAVTMGPPQADAVIKEAYMMGVDEGYLLTDRKFAGADVLATAYALSQSAKRIANFDLIICGKMTTDGDTAQVGPEMAEFLQIPHVANVRKIIEKKQDSIVVEMDMAETVEIQEVKLPCLITVEKDIFMPRLPSFKRKLATKKREIQKITLQHLDDQNEEHYGLNGSPTQVLKVFPPEKSATNEKWTGNGVELGEKLAVKLKELKFV